MSGTTLFFDRVKITLFGAPYLQDGFINNFRAEANYNTSLVQGMTKAGNASGGVLGNEENTTTWEEFYTPRTEFVDIGALIRGNPLAASVGQMIVQPVSIGTGVATGRAMVFTSLFIPRITTIDSPGQGQVAKRNVTLLAASFAYL